MLSLKNLIFRLFDTTIDDLRSEMEARNKVASGKTLKSFELRDTEDGYELVQVLDDAAPLYILQEGREPGKAPYDFTSILEKWSEEKGIVFTTERERHSFAYLLGKRIKERGIQGSPDEWITEILEKVNIKLEDVIYEWTLDTLGIK